MLNVLTIGELAHRTGLSISAIRFYEKRKLIDPIRSNGNQRRFARADIRRLSFIIAAQRIGLTLGEIENALSSLPNSRAPSRQDWSKMAQDMRSTLDFKIKLLERTRDKLDGCIGCGCLSLDVCALYNADDHAGLQGSGPRFIMNP